MRKKSLTRMSADEEKAKTFYRGLIRIGADPENGKITR
jgi:hypothetical protein